MTAVARRSGAVEPGTCEQVSGRPDLVRREVARRVRDGHTAGLVVTQTTRGVLPDGTVVVDVTFHPAPPMRSRPVGWWRGRSWKFWTPVAAGAVLALGACLVAAVVVLKAIIAAVVAVATMALGALVIVGFVALLGSTGGGGSFSGTFKGRMD